MEKYLKINLGEAEIISWWFLCVKSEGFDDNEDYDLNEKIGKFIVQEEEKEEDGKRATENNQRKQTD